MYIAENKNNLAQKITISVISDLVTDQRIHKVATTLHNNGFVVKVIGAKRKKSLPLIPQNYKTKRISLIFQKGFLQYAEWNFRLFFYLFFQKTNIFVANDLDTLLPNFLQSKLRNKKLVYDSHEYFTEQEELIHRKTVQKIWLKLEQFIFPKLKNVITVNESIANIYKKLYKVNVSVIKNLPVVSKDDAVKPTEKIVQLLQPFLEKKILLTQGTGFNANRGIDELIEAMQYLNDEYILCIVGSGLVIEKLKQKALGLYKLEKVVFVPTIPQNELRWITQKAYLGFSLDKPTCLNYEYSLPNKLFDFLQATLPVIVSNRVEVEKVVKGKYGIVLVEVSPQAIADAILLIKPAQYELMKTKIVADVKLLTWENQENILFNFYTYLK